MLDLLQLNSIAATAIAGGAFLLSIKVLMNCYDHLPLKYGKPEPNGSPPAVPKGQSGTFHASYDGRLWLFERRWEPKGEVKATLRILHGTVDHSGVYDELATKLTEMGIAVFASDMRGWGLSDGEQLYFNDMDAFVEDVRSDQERVHSEPRYSTVKSRFLLGKSLGGLIAAHTVARHPDLCSGLIGLSGAFEISSKLPPAPVMWLMHFVALLAPKTPLKPAFDPKLIVSDPDAFEAWKQDPLVSRGKATVTYITTIAAGANKIPALAPQITTPMLMMWGTGDEVVSLKGHRDMITLSKTQDKELKQYQGAYHNILAEPTCKAQAMDDILSWILNRCK